MGLRVSRVVVASLVQEVALVAFAESEVVWEDIIAVLAVVGMVE